MQQHKEQNAPIDINKPDGSDLALIHFCQTQLYIIDQWRKALTSLQQSELSRSSIRNYKIQELNGEPQSKSIFDTPGSPVPFISLNGHWLNNIGFYCGQQVQVVTLPQLIIIIPGI